MYSGYIKTVKGLIEPNMLGYCQCHEHIYIKGDIDDINLSTKELIMYKSAGGDSIVDAQPQNAGSSLDVLKKLSIDSGVNIVASTGFHKSTYYESESEIYVKSQSELAGMFIDEIQQGAGIIKTAVCGEINGIYKKLHETVAYAAKSTGSPIICHIDKGSSLIQVVSFYLNRGVSPTSLILCHADRFVEDMVEHINAAKEGVFLEYDTIARPKYHSDVKEIEKIKYMIDKGFIDNILIGLDTTKERLKSYGHNVGLTYIIDTFIPLLKQNGLKDEEIKQITIDNCKKALSFK